MTAPNDPTRAAMEAGANCTWCGSARHKLHICPDGYVWVCDKAVTAYQRALSAQTPAEMMQAAKAAGIEVWNRRCSFTGADVAAALDAALSYAFAALLVPMNAGDRAFLEEAMADESDGRYQPGTAGRVIALIHRALAGQAAAEAELGRVGKAAIAAMRDNAALPEITDEEREAIMREAGFTEGRGIIDATRALLARKSDGRNG